jgi:hypothetical protein
MTNKGFFTSEANRNRDKWKHADSESNGQRSQSEDSGLSVIEINQKHHEEILRQMKINNVASCIIAIAALGGAISFIVKIFK